MSKEALEYALAHLAGHMKEAGVFKDVPYLSVEDLAAGDSRISGILTSILARSEFQACGEEIALKAFVAETSGRGAILTGRELWGKLQGVYSRESGGGHHGVDTESLAVGMESRITAALQA